MKYNQKTEGVQIPTSSKVIRGEAAGGRTRHGRRFIRRVLSFVLVLNMLFNFRDL